MAEYGYLWYLSVVFYQYNRLYKRFYIKSILTTCNYIVPDAENARSL